MADATSANAASVPPPNRPGRPLSEALLNEKVGTVSAKSFRIAYKDNVLTGLS